MIPGTAKMMGMSCSISHGPNQPCAPKTRTKTSPEMTGETPKGMSIRVVSTFLPVNWNLVMAHAAARPNSVFMGTEIPTASSDSSMADTVSGCRMLSR